MHHVSLPKHLVVISVNAETEPPHNLDLSAAAPGVTALLNAVSGAQIRRYCRSELGQRSERGRR
jgi:hypothetical protein